MNLNSIMKELGEKWSTPAPQSDALGRYQIIINDDLVIQLEPSPYREGLYIYGLIGEVHGLMSERLYEMALTENLFGKGTGPASIGLDPHSRQLCLFQHLPQNTLNYSELEDALSTFAAYLETWQERLKSPIFENAGRRAL